MKECFPNFHLVQKIQTVFFYKLIVFNLPLEEACLCNNKNLSMVGRELITGSYQSILEDYILLQKGLALEQIYSVEPRLTTIPSNL